MLQVYQPVPTLRWGRAAGLVPAGQSAGSS